MNDPWFTFGPDVLSNIIGGLVAGIVVGVIIWRVQISGERARERKRTQFAWDQIKADLVIAMGVPEQISLEISEGRGRTRRVLQITSGKPISQWADILAGKDIRALRDLLSAIERLKIAADSVTSRTEPALQQNRTDWLALTGRSDALELWVGAVANQVPRVELNGFFPGLTEAAEGELNDACTKIRMADNTTACMHSYNLEQNRVSLAYDRLMAEMGTWFQTDVTRP